MEEKTNSAEREFSSIDLVARKIDKIMGVIEDTIGFTCFTAMLLVVLYNIVMRYILKLPNNWGEETARYLFIVLSFAACSLCVREGSHLGVTVIHDKLTGKAQRVMEFVVDIISFATYVSLVFIMSSYVAVAVKSGQVTPSLRIPFYYLYAALEVSFIMCVIRSIMVIWNKYISKTHPLDAEFEEVMM